MIRIVPYGDSYVTRDEPGFRPFISAALRMTVIDQRPAAPETILEQTQHEWLEPSGWVPLHPNARFDGAGLQGGGLRPFFTRKRSPEVDLADELSRAGLVLGSERTFIANPKATNGFAPKGHFAEAPHDAPLVISILNQLGTAEPDEARRALVNRWLELFLEGRKATPADKAILRRLGATQMFGTGPLARIRQADPLLFVDRFADYFTQIETNDQESTLEVAQFVVKKVVSDPPGTHLADTNPYLAALRSGKHRNYLIKIVGRFSVDPTPFLRNAQEGKDRLDDWFIFRAACNADPRWVDTVGPFVHAKLLTILLEPADYELDQDGLRDGATALLHLGRRDLAEDIRDRIGWAEAVLRPGHSQYKDNADRLRENTMGNFDRPGHC